MFDGQYKLEGPRFLQENKTTSRKILHTLCCSNESKWLDYISCKSLILNGYCVGRKTIVNESLKINSEEKALVIGIKIDRVGRMKEETIDLGRSFQSAKRIATNWEKPETRIKKSMCLSSSASISTQYKRRGFWKKIYIYTVLLSAPLE